MLYNLPTSASNLVYMVGAIIFLGVLFSFLFILNVYVVERLSRVIYKKRLENQTESQEYAVELLEQAREQAFDIIQDANIKAQDILNKTGSVSSDADSTLKGEIERLHSKHLEFLENISEDTISAYKRVAEDEKSKGLGAIEETVSDVEDVASEAITALKTEIDTQKKSYEEFFGENMKREIENVRNELREYREKKILDINNEAKVILKDVCKEVLGKSLPLENHEDLIMESLERAKVMGVFGNE